MTADIDLLGATLAELMAAGPRGARPGRLGPASPIRPRCSSRSRCCVATSAATAPSPSRRPASTSPYLTPGRGAGHRPGRARRRAATRRCSRWASGPRLRYPVARELARRPRLRLDRRLPGRDVRGWWSTRSACSPTPTPAPSSPTSWPRSATVAASQGMMIESLNRDLEAHRGSPDKTPERRLATLEAAGELAIPFTTGILVGIGESGPTQLAALEAIAALAPPLRPRAGGHRPELPAQAGHDDVPGRALPHRRLPRGHRPGPPDPAARRPPAGPAQPVRRLRRPARRRHRRLGRRLARHRRPRQPRAALARPRPAARRHREQRATRWPPA